MKKVLILFGKKKWDSPAFQNGNDSYRKCYEYLYRLAEKNDIELFRASFTWYDADQNIFKYAWTFKCGEWIRVHDINPDLIYDKTSYKAKTTFFKSTIAEVFPIVNNVEFSELIDNKLFVSLLFPQYCKKQHKALNQKNLLDIAKSINTEKIVVKPSTDSGGKNVHILDKANVNTLKVGFPVLVQEFIDSSGGIDDIVDSVHDLRLVFIEDSLVHSYIRIPAKGSLLANLSQGGSIKIISSSQLPSSLKDLVSTVQDSLQTFENKIYTIDIMFDENQKPWIIELNSMPGLFFAENQRKEMKLVYKSIIDLFKKILSS